MINLTGKSVFVKTQEEYLSVLKIAKLQGFTWARENHLNSIVIPFPNILNFYDSKIVTYSYVEKTVYEASELLRTKEITAREFAEWIANTYSLCGNRKCSECVLSKNNTKCDVCLCGIDAKDNLAEEIADVLICIEMLKQLYNVLDLDIESWIMQKQQRVMDGMKEA